MRRRLVWTVAIVALAGVLVALGAFAQERQEKKITGAVVSVDLEKMTVTVKGDETGQVVVLNVGWKQIEGKWVMDPAQVEIIKTLKPGDKVTTAYFFGEERWIIREISKVGAAAPTNIGEQLKAMDARLVAMEKKLDNIEAMLKQLLAK